MENSTCTLGEQKVIQMLLESEFKDFDIKEWFEKDLQRLKDAGCFENVNKPNLEKVKDATPTWKEISEMLFNQLSYYELSIGELQLVLADLKGNIDQFSKVSLIKFN